MARIVAQLNSSTKISSKAPVEDYFLLNVNSSIAVDTRLLNKNASIAKNIYSTQNHSLSTYVRNINCWAYDVDLTGISPWNSSGYNQLAGTLMTPRHVIFAEHFHPWPGTVMRFITKDNQIIQRTITAVKTHPDYRPYYPDINIAVLDNDAPSSIKFCKILPTNWQTYLNTFKRTPCLALDQEEKALVTDGNTIGNFVNFMIPINSKRLEFFENIIGGDSSNPCFMIINGELVILTIWTFGGAGAGTSVLNLKNDINTMISQLDTQVGINTGYQLTHFDLSFFKVP